MSKLSDLKPYLKETLALQDILLSLGHDQDDVFVFFNGKALGVSVLKDEVHHPLPAVLCPPELTKETFVSEFKEACLTWNQSSQEDRHKLVEESVVRQRAGLIIANLVEQDLMPIKKADFPCPFCGAHVCARGDDSSVLHAAPPCPKFLSLNPLAFLKACRHEIVGN